MGRACRPPSFTPSHSSLFVPLSARRARYPRLSRACRPVRIRARPAIGIQFSFRREPSSKSVRWDSCASIPWIIVVVFIWMIFVSLCLESWITYHCFFFFLKGILRKCRWSCRLYLFLWYRILFLVIFRFVEKVELILGKGGWVGDFLISLDFVYKGRKILFFGWIVWSGIWFFSFSYLIKKVKLFSFVNLDFIYIFLRKGVKRAIV